MPLRPSGPCVAARPTRFVRASVRFVRSCSASLAPAVLADLERLAACVCCEAYAMTEVCHGHGAARVYASTW